MEPANTSILYLEMILPLLMEGVTSDCVKYGMVSPVGVDFDPCCYTNRLTGLHLRNNTYKKHNHK